MTRFENKVKSMIHVGDTLQLQQRGEVCSSRARWHGEKCAESDAALGTCTDACRIQPHLPSATRLCS
jgi:hypothetical protein